MTQRSPLNPTTDGYIDIKVRDPGDAVYTSLLNDSIGTSTAGPNSLQANFVDTPVWYWGESGLCSWQTGALDADTSRYYPLGTYKIWAESTLHGMKDNYLSGDAYYTGRTVSPIYTLNLTMSIPGIHPLPGFTNLPTDPDGDSLFEDLNANNRMDFNDVVLMFNQMLWIAANEPVSAFDFNGNGRIDFNDIVKLFGEI
jgi:hypothetical protein